MSYTNLDPILGAALKLEELPIVSGRQWAVAEASTLAEVLMRLASRAEVEGDTLSQQMLLNVAESLAVMTVSLVAYTRGRVPQVASQAPNTNIVLPS